MGQQTQNDSLRRDVLEFIKQFYDENEKAPSISEIARRVPGAYREKFYKLFPGKLAEACRAAGVDVPEERIKSMEKATGVKAKPRAPGASVDIIKITLSEEQSKRVFGLSHLENGKDTSLIIDELLGRDQEFRSAGLNLEDTKVLLEFLREMERRGWSSESTLSFLNNLTVRILIPLLTPEMGQDLIEFLKYPNPRELSLAERIKELSAGLRISKWYSAQARGEITKQEFLEAVKTI